MESYSTILARKIFKYFQISDLNFYPEKKKKATRKEPVRPKINKRKEIINFSAEISDIENKKKKIEEIKSQSSGEINICNWQSLLVKKKKDKN